MHGVNAELKGHSNKEYKFVFDCGCPKTDVNSTFIKKQTHKKLRHETKQTLHKIKQEIDSLNNHLDYQFSNNEGIWTKNMDSF